jgi:hypothetical protein
MIKINSNEYYEMKFEKKSRTWVQVFSLENMKMFAQYLC